RSGELKSKLANIGRRIEELSEQKEDAQTQMADAEDHLRTLHTGWPEFDLEARLRFAEDEAKTIDLSRAEVLREEIMGRLMKAERALSETLQDHNRRTTRPSDAIVYTSFAGVYDENLFSGICELRREIDRVFNLLKNNVLVEKHTQLQQLKLSFNNAFVSHL